MRTLLAISLLFTLLLAGCPDRSSTQKPSPKKAAPATETPATETAATEAPAAPATIEPVALGELTSEPLAAVVAKLTQAHYDAESLGLKGLEGSVEFTSRKMEVLARAKVKWTSGSPPEVSLTEVEKDGKKIPAPTGQQPDEIGRAIGWADMQFQILKLVEGLGNGYLAHRLLEWKEATGEVNLTDGALTLAMDHKDQGKVNVAVQQGYAVKSVEAIHPKGFSRKMTYEVQMEQGRNLVTGALLEAKANTGAKLHDKAHKMLKAINGTRFEIGYSKAGRFMLPVKLRKEVPSMKEEITLSITYDKVTP